VEPGGVAVLGGRSGCGKSSLLEICAGLLKPSAGSALWDGENISGMAKYELYARRKNLGYVFQVHALISNHTVFDNIALPLKCGTDLSGGKIKERVKAQMDELGICSKTERKFPEALSAAQLRSVALARALVSSPKLLILDEPTGGVDPVTAGTITDVLHKRWKRDGMSIIMAAHSVNAWPDWNAKRYMLQDGRLGPAEEAFAGARDIRRDQGSVYGK
jgi:ABC-type lipoprotein export system ATPase subunit